MRKIFFTTSLFLTGIVLFLTGCQSTNWHLAATKKGDQVEICLSNGPTCPQPGGVIPSSISVYRYDSTYDNELVWDAEPDSPITGEKISGAVIYGVPPAHWRNKLTPPAPVCGKAYLVNPAAEFFALKCDGSVVVFDFQHLEEFFRDNASAKPAQTRELP